MGATRTETVALIGARVVRSGEVGDVSAKDMMATGVIM